MLNNNQKTDLMNYYNDGLKSIKLTRREVVKTKVNESRIQKLKYQKLKGKDSNSTLEEKDNANQDKVTYPVASQTQQEYMVTTTSEPDLHWQKYDTLGN